MTRRKLIVDGENFIGLQRTGKKKPAVEGGLKTIFWRKIVETDIILHST
jgi:hypothetical protein